MRESPELSLRGAELGDAVPQTPWDLSLWTCTRRSLAGRGRETPPGLVRLARLQAALGSHPCVALSSAGAKRAFPVSVSRGGYREGKGQREFELVAARVPHDFAGGGELGQGGADGGGAHAAQFAQVLQGRGFRALRQGLAHALPWRGGKVGLHRGAFRHRQGQGRARLGELEGDVVAGGSGAMLRGEGQLGAFAPHVEVGVPPGRAVSPGDSKPATCGRFKTSHPEVRIS